MKKTKLVYIFSGLIIGIISILIAYCVIYLTGTSDASGQRRLVIQSADASMGYDGTSLSKHEYVIKEGALSYGHTLKLEFTGKQTEVGESDNTFTATIMNGNADVTSMYNVGYLFGKLKVDRRVLEITTGSDEKKYDREPLVNDEYNIQSGTLLENHTFSAKFTCTPTEAGKYENVIEPTVVDEKGVDVSNQYKVILYPGELVVTPRRVHISTPSKTKYYDGKPLESSEYEILEQDLLPGDELVVTPNTKIKGIGSQANKVKVQVLNEGKDVTKNYDIQVDEGKLEIRPIKITIKSGSATKLYDKLPLTKDIYDLIGNLLDGHKLKVQITGEITEPGKNKNTITSVDIIDEDGNIVNDLYDINKIEGDLEIKRDDISDLSKEPTQNANNPVFKCTTNYQGSIYLRLDSKANYNYDSWGLAKNGYTCSELDLNPLFFVSNALKDKSLPSYHLKLDMIMDGIDYMYPYYLSEELVNSNDYKLDNAFGKNYELDFWQYNYLQDGFVAVDGVNSDLERDYYDYVKSTYLQIGDSTKADLLRIAEEQGLAPKNATTIEIIANVANYIKTAARYNLKYEKFPDGVDMAVYFLTDAREGICQHFATSAAMMYRALGIPARYVTGFLVNAEPDKEITVKADRAHAWVEVYIEGMGWINVEATGSDNPNNPDDGEENGGMGQDGGLDSDNLTIKPIDVHVKQGYGSAVAQNKLQGLNKLEMSGFTYDCVVSGKQDTLGKSYSFIESFVLYDPEGNDVTKNYKIDYKKGILQVYDVKLDIYSESLSKVYDGKNIGVQDWRYVGDLKEGHYIDKASVKRIKDFKDVGKYLNIVDFIIRDSKGADVTDIYYLDKKFGYLEITPKDLTVVSLDAEAEYTMDQLMADEINLECKEYHHEGLVFGDKISVKIEGNLQGPGEIENAIKSVIIKDEEGNIINANYKIKTINGKLIVRIIEN